MVSRTKIIKVIKNYLVPNFSLTFYIISANTLELSVLFITTDVISILIQIWHREVTTVSLDFKCYKQFDKSMFYG
ncbi:hypothetical protein CLV51_103323 [Chitinophaga niastensis]|uniref:Uncharacterized protein n=1 Tax=Chitinophaga niastensis TaxID=536980 RepID=A0A2P8HJG3_CHINA|nr:hypothetical protein CLV51_103323 [Chitinophaga niastensis]